MNKEIIIPKIARLFSIMFIPPINLLYLFIYLSISYERTIINKFTVIFVAFIFGFVLPVLLFFYLRHTNKIGNQDATKKEERQIPYLFSTLFAIFAVVILIFLDINSLIIIAWITYVINTIVLTMINKYWKISAHAIGIASPWAIILYTNSSLFPVFLIILLLVGWSRIKLNVHSTIQVIAGSLLGFCFTLFEIFIGLKLTG